MCHVCASGTKPLPTRSSALADRLRRSLKDPVAAGRRMIHNAPALGRSGPILIEPGWVLTCDEDDRLELVRDHTVVVVDDVIADVVPRRKAGRDRHVDLNSVCHTERDLFGNFKSKAL